MITPSISYSFLSYSAPWNRMLRYLLSVGKIRCKIIIILIHYNDTHRLSDYIPINTEKYSNVFLVSCCKRIIRFSIKTSNHQTLKSRWNLGFWKIHKIYKRNSGFPLTRWGNSPIWYCLRKGYTLSSISHLRKLRILTITCIIHWTWIRMICHHHEIFHIDSWTPSCQYLPTWNDTNFPVFCWNTNIEKWANMWEWGLNWCRHRIINYWTIVPPHSTTENHFLSNFWNCCGGIFLYSVSGLATMKTLRRESGVGEIESLAVSV